MFTRLFKAVRKALEYIGFPELYDDPVITMILLHDLAGSPVKLWMDDKRPPPSEEWIWVKDAESVSEIVPNHRVDTLSLGTGCQLESLLSFLEFEAVAGRYIPPIIQGHATNAQSRDRIQTAIININKILDENKRHAHFKAQSFHIDRQKRKT